MEEEKPLRTTKTVNMRVSLNFKKLIEQLIKNEQERGNVSCSEPTATEILYKRIQNLGGLRKT